MSDFNEQNDEFIMELSSVDKKLRINGREYVCPICSHKKFRERRTLMNTPGMTFFGLEWANKEADNFICEKCGYVLWFLNNNK